MRAWRQIAASTIDEKGDMAQWVPDFVYRGGDALLHGGMLDDSIDRGHYHLATGAATVNILGQGKESREARKCQDGTHHVG